MTIDYDAEKLSGWCGLPRLFFRYRGTILAGTFKGPMFWIPNLVHIGLCALGGQFFIFPGTNVTSLALERRAENEKEGGFQIYNDMGYWSGISLSNKNLQVRSRRRQLHSSHGHTPAPPCLLTVCIIIACACAAGQGYGSGEPLTALLLHRLLQ